MYTLIAFATEWGSKHGGINSFNADFLKQFGAAYHHSVEIICVITQHTPEALEEAAKSHVRLIALPYVPESRSFDASIGSLSVDLLARAGVAFDPEHTVWLGHDLITGEAAIAAAKVGGGRSAVIHHMSYDDYESYAKDTESAQKKTAKQTAILKGTDLILAIGPLLRDAASDRVEASKGVHMLVPGLPEIETKEAPKRFVAFVSGRLSADAARIKQGHLGVAAFAAAELKARNEGVPEPLIRQPKLLLRGVDFENRKSELDVDGTHDPEIKLQKFADEYAKGVVNIHALPYTEDRQQLYLELSGSSVALMPSWHEGFGLVAWEAIAAGVPLIVGENTGVYRLLDDEYSGAQTGYVYPVYVSAKRESPYFQPEDLEKTVNALRSVALDPAKARMRAGKLRNELLEKYGWPNCCENAANAFGWHLQRGSVSDRTQEIVQEVIGHSTVTASPSVDVGPLKIPRGQWRPGAGMADSQLLRAEEELLPFDTRRQPDVDKLREWIAGTNLLTVRLITGDGGQGKTRLAIHFCQQLRAEGWQSGFLDSSLEASRMALLWQDLSKLNQPTFIVVDYAETRQEAFLALLKAALESPLDKPVRMLLLARNGGEWWDNLPSTNSFCEALLTGPATTGPFGLPPLYEQQRDRQQAFSDALGAFAKILQVANPQIVPELVGDQFQRPLFIQIAALLALYGERPTTIQGLTKAILNHERRYWVGLLAPIYLQEPGRQAEQLLALATLAGGFPTARIAGRFWTIAKGDVLTNSEFNSLFRNLAALYPGAEGLQALRPDLLGEALVAQALLRPDGDVLLDAVLSSSASQLVRRNALTVLARTSIERTDVDEILIEALSRQFRNCATELVAVSTETISRLPELAQSAFEQLSAAAKSQLAGLLMQSLPEESVQLGGLRCQVCEHIAGKARERFEQRSSLERTYEYAKALQGYAVALSITGQYQTASEVGQTALLLLRQLRSKDRVRYEAAYARCISNHARDLLVLERAEEAEPYAIEAIRIYERLVEQDENRFQYPYAVSLDRYAQSLSSVGRGREAVTQIELAAKINSKLVERNPHRFEGRYGLTLLNYAFYLSILGQTEQAISTSSKALDFLQRAAQKNPDRFEPEYAACLTNHANYLMDLSRIKEAAEYAIASHEINRRLVRTQPKRFGVDLLLIDCLTRFLNWLAGQEHRIDVDYDVLLPLILPHQQNSVHLYFDFVEGCAASDVGHRQRYFHLVLSHFRNLTGQSRRNAAPYFLCAAVWCATFDSTENTDEWQTNWTDYCKKRQNNLPVWMLEVARRLNFEFPALPDLIVSQRADGVDAGGAGGGIQGGGDGDEQGEEDGAHG